ncbi:LysE family translocator [Marinobacterium arenosum]|uniref:LysE family translocator n=1 Tax=Marinobacterium arenosum TaxID=2862496 RepID=UPI001C96B918|nr:LysE family translocator [Marinobacterium arenosum]MBY4678419.1 LysE family translocator [Marinobacterium arenosum]
MLDQVIMLSTATALLLGSPGPAPLALAATSATFGVKRSFPFLFGILAGLIFVITTASTGFAVILSSAPQLKFALQLLGAAYIGYIAWKIASAPITGTEANAKCPSLVDGFVLNLLNPKAYAAFFALFSQFLLPIEDVTSSYVITGGICFAVALLVDTGWVLLGGALKQLFEKPRAARVLRVSFALSMLGAVFLAFQAVVQAS